MPPPAGHSFPKTYFAHQGMKKRIASRFFRKRRPSVSQPVVAPAPAPTPTYQDASTSTGGDPSIYQYLRGAKEILQGSASGSWYVWVG